MSKDDFPPGLSPHAVLENMFLFMEEWKAKLYDLISSNSFNLASSPQVLALVYHLNELKIPSVRIWRLSFL